MWEERRKDFSLVIIEISTWEAKEKMREKKKLGSRTCIKNKLTEE